MKYFIIENNLDPDVTGMKHGSSPAGITPDLFKDKPWLDEFLYGKNAGLRRGDFPNQDFKLERIRLDYGANHNDFISVGALRCGFIINEKVKELLNSFQLPPHKYFPVTFEQKGKIIDGYYWFYYNLFDGRKYVNYDKSIFDTKDEEDVLKQKIVIKNYEDYIKLTLKMNRSIHLEKIVFDKTFDKGIDLFGMRFFGSRNYISERLKQKLEENNIKGYVLRYPLTDPEVEWE